MLEWRNGYKVLNDNSGKWYNLIHMYMVYIYIYTLITCTCTCTCAVMKVEIGD